jgi:hypothetical protein
MLNARVASPCFGVVSAGRPREAARALASFEECGRGTAPMKTLLVHDGAPAELAEYRRALRAARVDGAEVVSVAERRSLAHALSRRTGVSNEILEWAILGSPDHVSTGSARNALQLLCAGESLLAVDDDVVTLPPQPDGRLSPMRVALPHEAARFELGVLPPDASGAREPLLAALSRQLEESAAVGAAGAAAGRHGARVVQPRLTGLCAFDTPFWNLLLARSDADYAEHRLTRRLSMGPNGNLLLREHPFMSYAALYDGRRMLPPWPARGRSSDSCFGAALAAMHRGHAFCASDVAVEHRASRTEDFPEQDRWLASGPPCGGALIAAALREIRSTGDDLAERRDESDLVRGLGRGLAVYADGAGSRLSRLAEQMLRARESACRRVGEQAAPRSRRRADADESVARIVATLERGGEFPPRDHRGGLAAFLEEVRRYAALLVAWPDVWRAARELRGLANDAPSRGRA